MKESLSQDLKSLACNGNVASLPKEQLNDYALLKKTLTQACGKYKRNTFEFPYPAQFIINRLLAGETINFKKEFQFFPTPEDLADYMAGHICFDKEVMNILEPGAGHGALIDAVLRLDPKVEIKITAIELAELNYEVLVAKYANEDRVTIVRGDFLKLDPKIKFDVVIANPPFTKNQDIDHINRMYNMLAKNGRLISVASPSWSFGKQAKQVEFKRWLDEDVAANYHKLEKGTFKSSGTMVESFLIIIDK